MQLYAIICNYAFGDGCAVSRWVLGTASGVYTRVWCRTWCRTSASPSRLAKLLVRLRRSKLWPLLDHWSAWSLADRWSAMDLWERVARYTDYDQTHQSVKLTIADQLGCWWWPCYRGERAAAGFLKSAQAEPAGDVLLWGFCMCVYTCFFFVYFRYV